jgi:threonine dehydratase
VQAAGADAMEKSWRTGALVFPPAIATIADGIGVRAPIAEAVEDMRGLVDDVVLVEDVAIIRAMKMLFDKAGLIVEPSGAAGVAAVLADQAAFRGLHAATILCGSNLTQDQIREWLL